MNLDLRHLQLIQTVASEGSLSKASQVLNLTQSALSHRLKDLEGIIKSPLFIRTRKRMLLTPVGEELLKTADIVLDHLRSAEKKLNHLQQANAGEIRLSTQCYTCYHWLPGILARYQKKYPNVKVQIQVEATHHPLEFLRQGQLDLAIVFDPPDTTSQKVIPLFEDELVVVVSSLHRLARKSVVEPHDLENEMIYLYSQPDRMSYLARHVFQPAGVTLRNVRTVQLTEAILEFVKSNMGIGILASWVVSPLLKNKSLKALRLTRKGLSRTWYAVIRSGDTPTEYQAEFIELLKRDGEKMANRKPYLFK